MNKHISAERHPAFGLSVALSNLNDALQGERDGDREQRIWDTWAETCSLDYVSTDDAVWFIGHATGGEWVDVFFDASERKHWPRETEIDDLMSPLEDEPASTRDVIDQLDQEHTYLRNKSEADNTKANLRAERLAYIAVQGLKARYARTGDDNMGW